MKKTETKKACDEVRIAIRKARADDGRPSRGQLRRLLAEQIKWKCQRDVAALQLDKIRDEIDAIADSLSRPEDIEVIR